MKVNEKQKKMIKETKLIACNIALWLTTPGFKTNKIVCSLRHDSRQVQRNNTEGRRGYECR